MDRQPPYQSGPWATVNPYEPQPSNHNEVPSQTDYPPPPPPPPPMQPQTAYAPLQSELYSVENSYSPQHQSFRAGAPPRRNNRPEKEDRNDREERYTRISTLTRELSAAVRDEMSRRKQQWDVEDSRAEEEYWETRKQQVYKDLEKLADEIRRAFRDRRKEAVLDLWSREQEGKRAAAEPQDGY